MPVSEACLAFPSSDLSLISLSPHPAFGHLLPASQGEGHQTALPAMRGTSKQCICFASARARRQHDACLLPAMRGEGARRAEEGRSCLPYTGCQRARSAATYPFALSMTHERQTFFTATKTITPGTTPAAAACHRDRESRQGPRPPADNAYATEVRRARAASMQSPRIPPATPAEYPAYDCE